MKSCVKVENGNPTLFVDGKPVPAIAYTTYFQERNRYEDFINAGYRMFFVNVSFTLKPFNSARTGFSSFNIGAFENPDAPDYRELDDYVKEILDKCPDAMIVPRIYVGMPTWWAESHPEETVLTPKGGYKEMLFSEAYRRDGAALLARMVQHIRGAWYAPSVMGWQICGGQTQEWFHPDHFGSLCPAGEKYYRAWAKEKYGIENAVLPTPEELRGDGAAVCEDENVKHYFEFCNDGVARTMNHFAKRLKEETNYEQVVGTFYGYCMDFTCPLSGSQGLRFLLDSPYFDYFCAPSSYAKTRQLGIDWKDQFPVDAIKHHGKLPFVECDIRTYLTTSIQAARPGRYPDDIYQPKSVKGTATLWEGPPTPELSREALRKSFCHQITRASAIWWFDMWGGWYDDPLLMADLTYMKDIYLKNCPFPPSVIGSEVVFFADERAYENFHAGVPAARSFVHTHIAMGAVGAPYDVQMVEDAAEVLPKYKAAIFASPMPSEAGQRAIELCKKQNIPCLVADMGHPIFKTAELRAFLIGAGVHVYIDNGDVIYAGNGFVGIHAASEGEKIVRLPQRCRVTPVFGSKFAAEATDSIPLQLTQYETALFALTPVAD